MVCVLFCFGVYIEKGVEILKGGENYVYEDVIVLIKNYLDCLVILNGLYILCFISYYLF